MMCPPPVCILLLGLLLLLDLPLLPLESTVHAILLDLLVHDGGAVWAVIGPLPDRCTDLIGIGG